MTQHSKLHNPNYIGPGSWFTIHSMAACISDENEKKCVIKVIRHLQKSFPCGDCRGHFGTYLDKNPPEMTLGGSLDSLFVWTVNFHNAVNYRLGKPQVSVEEARKIFYEDSEFCMKDCTKEIETKLNPKLIPKDLPGYMF